jgi:hypothetical protein
MQFFSTLSEKLYVLSVIQGRQYALSDCSGLVVDVAMWPCSVSGPEVKEHGEGSIISTYVPVQTGSCVTHVNK